MHDDFFAHEHFPEDALEDVEGLELFILKSVGIDIGSSTTHLVFSRLVLRREGASYSGKYRVTKREILFRSPIMLTPYLTETTIDTEKVKAFIEESYQKAGFTPDQIHTGAVIITGEALRKENARPIVEYFARYSGKFICATAGHNHEALLSAHGCGAVDISKEKQTNVLNVDIGGGTTKFAYIERGAVRETAAINVGARLLAFDEERRILRLEEAGRQLMEKLGEKTALGFPFTREQEEKLTEEMANIIVEIIRTGECPTAYDFLMVTDPLKLYRGFPSIDYLIFSGGVSEYIYGYCHHTYGDMGETLGKQIKAKLEQIISKQMLLEPAEGIRATVIGAGEYTIQASGNTSFISSVNSLPVYGLKVIPVNLSESDDPKEKIRQSLAKFGLTDLSTPLALSLSLDGRLDYPVLRKVAEGIATLLSRTPKVDFPLYLTINVDVAKSLGSLLQEELKIDREIIAIDHIEVGDLDFIDIGNPLGTTEVIPVTVKSLMFPPLKRDAHY